MQLEYSVDLISDLNLTVTDHFDWTGKPTSLFCIVAGNISSDLAVVKNVLTHLGTVYRGVLYIDGPLEHPDIMEYRSKVYKIEQLCKPIKNVVYMHNYVVVLNSIAFVGINGWYGLGVLDLQVEDDGILRQLQGEDVGYLTKTIKSLQLHKDANRIMVISNSLPADYLLYDTTTSSCLDGIEPGISLVMDTDEKVTHWLYGGPHPTADYLYNGRRFVNNPKIKGQPYWPKRIVIS